MVPARNENDADPRVGAPRPGQDRARLRHAAILLVAVAASSLQACRPLQKPEVRGSEKLPAEFGHVVARPSGCPDLGGLYAWPWAQGQPFGYRKSGRPDKYGDFIGMPLHAEAQVWVEGPANERAGEFWVRTRKVNRNPRVSISSLTREWSYQVRTGDEYSCSHGWVELPEIDLEGDSVAYWFGGKGVKVSGRVARVTDGSLVVGQRVRVWGRTNSVGWGDVTYGTFPAPDRVSWYWTRLERIGPTGDGVPAADAGPPDERVMLVIPRPR